MEKPVVLFLCTGNTARSQMAEAFPGVLTRMFWPFDDPAAAVGAEEEKLTMFREVRDQIEEQIKSWLKKVT